ncbi:MAG: hypothetical protein ACI9OJ_002851 [Myxococcota bacterium]|jgi:hypothetical protein
MLRKPYLWAIAVAALLGSGCSDAPLETEYETRTGPLNAYCTANVIGTGNVDVESHYLAKVIRCENGSAPLEALKAQAVAARSYLYYKLSTAGSIVDGQGDQVYSCGPQPSAIHQQAVDETAGIVLQYNNIQVAAFYVAGAIPTTSSCVPKASDNDWSNTEHYVTYNQGKSGGDLTQTTLGWVNSGNHANRGCKSQNGASCLANKGWGYADILKYYYGSDIQFVTATGTCVGQQCECTAGQSESKACGTCGSQKRTCGSNCEWGGWGVCSGQGICSPGTSSTAACGQCGTHSRTCTNSCAWGNYSNCAGEGPCSPGDSEQDSCGNCGSRSRSCNGACGWSGWTACVDEGACAVGAMDQMPCGDCGVQERVCNSTCEFGEFGSCGGVGPNDGTTCSTGADGICNQGELSCLSGVATCIGTVDPQDEVCDGLDNDCNGLADDGEPEIGTSIPDFAARLEQADVPGLLLTGESTTMSLTFRNVGGETWLGGGVWLTASGPADGATSPLYDTSWEAGAIAAISDADVLPGESLTLTFTAFAPVGSPGQLEERFVLAHSDGAMHCPAPAASLRFVVLDAEPETGTDGSDATAGVDGSTSTDGVTTGDDGETGADGQDTTDDGQTDATSGADNLASDGNSGCSAGGTAPSNPVWVLVFLMFGGIGYARRQSNRRQSNRRQSNQTSVSI